MTPLASWRVRPEIGRRTYVDITVWPSRRAMMRGLKETGRGSRYGVGRTISGRDPRRPTWLASIHLVLKASDENTITHEAFHATMALADRIGVLGTPAFQRKVHEERLAEAHGCLVEGIVKGFRRSRRIADALDRLRSRRNARV